MTKSRSSWTVFTRNQAFRACKDIRIQREKQIKVAINSPLFCNISVLNREHSALPRPRTEWINLPCNHLLSRHPQATEEGFGFGYSLLIGVNAF